ncbi:hypothetical protein M378DRAFT_159629 [Amanita muscaria Koide BX008]|uniref:Uncharacterized protein n=1 Tax=Amanita muscaria (strain Koide BX008) TaxID=946122 RepID=A0A0C2XEH5_AMAMK|nr:hypothetical protein M378DRAFT_159629 [Amanita muscaria Koide BX008]
MHAPDLNMVAGASCLANHRYLLDCYSCFLTSLLYWIDPYIASPCHIIVVVPLYL